jgi:hypothetical protein
VAGEASAVPCTVALNGPLRYRGRLQGRAQAADNPSVSEGRHRGQGRAKGPYLSLDRSRRWKILKDLVFGRVIDPVDEPFARDRAEQAASRLPHGLWMGSFFGAFLLRYWHSTTMMWVSLIVATAIYLFGLGFAIRMCLWLRRHPQ